MSATACRPLGARDFLALLLVDGELYLLPHEVDARDSVSIEASGLSVSELRGQLLELAKHGRVSVLLDACHSGATTMGEGTAS